MTSSTARAIGTTPACLGGQPLFDKPIRFMQPLLPPLEEVESMYRQAYSDGMITNATLVARLEAMVCEFLGVRHCVAVSSCTSGLMLVLRSLGVSGEVILPAFTFFATGHAGLWNGLQPVFADCERDSWNVDPVDVERKITSRTGAIVAVHLYGNPANTGRLDAIATRNGLRLIFDSAHAFGSSRRGIRVGSAGDAEVFSLSPTKILVAGEGGLVTTNDAALARRLRAGRNYGDTGSYDPELVGLSARMPEFNAALAIQGLEMVQLKVLMHNQIAAAYTAMLDGIPGLSFQAVDGNDLSSYKDYSVLVDPALFGMDRDQLADALLAENIPTRKYFHPALHEQRQFSRFSTEPGSLANTEAISRRVLSLPVYASLGGDSVEKIAWAVRRIHESAIEHALD